MVEASEVGCYSGPVSAEVVTILGNEVGIFLSTFRIGFDGDWTFLDELTYGFFEVVTGFAFVIHGGFLYAGPSFSGTSGG